jgi:hypothetical protein
LTAIFLVGELGMENESYTLRGPDLPPREFILVGLDKKKKNAVIKTKSVL